MCYLACWVKKRVEKNYVTADLILAKFCHPFATSFPKQSIANAENTVPEEFTVAYSALNFPPGRNWTEGDVFNPYKEF